MKKILFNLFVLLFGFDSILADSIVATECPQLYGVESPDADFMVGPIAVLADIDKDGFTDYAVSSHSDVSRNISANNVRVYSGKTGQRIYTIYAPAGLTNSIGDEMVTGGDYNQDGIPELIVGFADSGGYPAAVPGKVLIYSGKNGKLLHTINGPRLEEGFGDTSLAVADITGDGKPEIFVGAGKTEDPDDFRIYLGRIYIYSGSNFQLYNIWDSPTEQSFLFPGELITIKDLNGDGVAELVGSQSLAYGQGGWVRVFSGKTGDVLIDLEGPQGLGLGFSIADLGDLNGDGKHDLGLITDKSVYTQTLYILSGAAIAEGEVDVVAQLALSDEDDDYNWSCRFGVSKPYDVDHDGTMDFLIGCPSRTVNHLYSLSGEILLVSGADFSVILSDGGSGAYAGLGRAGAIIPKFGHADYFGVVSTRKTELSDGRGSFRVYGISEDLNNNGKIDVCDAASNTNSGGNGSGNGAGNGGGSGGNNSNDADVKAKSAAWLAALKTHLGTALTYRSLLLKRLLTTDQLERIRSVRGDVVYRRKLILRRKIHNARLAFRDEVNAVLTTIPNPITSSAGAVSQELKQAATKYNNGLSAARWKSAKKLISEALDQFEHARNL